MSGLPGMSDRKLTFTKAPTEQDQRARLGIEALDSPARAQKFSGFKPDAPARGGFGGLPGLGGGLPGLGGSRPPVAPAPAAGAEKRVHLFAETTLQGGVQSNYNSLPGMRQVSSLRSIGRQNPKETRPNVPETFTVQMAERGDLVASGGSDGIARVFSTRTGNLISQMPTEKSENMIMSMRFLPKDKTNKLVVTYTDGSVRWWDTYNKDCIRRIDEPENEIYTMSFSQSGEFFATGGSDYKVRVYENRTGAMITDLERVGDRDEIRGHSNRVFCVKYHPYNDNVVVSSGWDDTVQIWDMRAGGKVQRYFHGPHVCGEALDLHDNAILVGSYRAEKQLQIFDFDTCKMIEEVDWMQSTPKYTSVYAAQFSPDGQMIAAGGVNEPCVKIFSMKTGKELAAVSDINPDYCLSCIHIHPDQSKMAVGLPSNNINIYDISHVNDKYKPKASVNPYD